MDPIDSGVPNRSRRSAFMGRLWNGNPSGDLTKALSTFEAVAPGFNNTLSLTFRSLSNVELVQPPKAGHAEYRFIHHMEISSSATPRSTAGSAAAERKSSIIGSTASPFPAENYLGFASTDAPWCQPLLPKTFNSAIRGSPRRLADVGAAWRVYSHTRRWAKAI